MSDLGTRLRRGLQVRLTRWLGLEAEEVPLSPLRPEDLTSLQSHFPHPKFFVIGYPRSGTTLLARLLRLHPEVYCAWQGHFASGRGDLISRLARPDLMAWLNRSSNRWSSGEELAPAVLRAATDWILERAAEEHGARWVGDKTPTARGEEAVARLAQLYPDAHLIHIVRDGRDAAVSQRFQAFIDQPETLRWMELRLRSALVERPEDFGPEGRSIFTADWLERVASHWAQTVSAGHKLAAETYDERYHALRFEQLIHDPWREMTSLWGFLGAGAPAELRSAVREAMERNPAASWHAEQAPELVASLERGAAGGWRDWFTPSDLRRFQGRAGEALETWGYEPARQEG